MVMPMLWIMANSRFREMIAVTMLLTKFRTPTSAMMMLMAYPITAVARVSASYCAIRLSRKTRFMPGAVRS